MSEEEKKHVQPIKPELRGILNRFLLYPDYQKAFLAFADVLGYKGNDIEEARKLMFFATPDGEIRFTIAGLYDLFLEFQLLEQLSNTEPYKTLLKENPASIRKIRELVKQIMDGKQVTNEDVMKLFNKNGTDSK